jgi:hypothetical protein
MMLAPALAFGMPGPFEWIIILIVFGVPALLVVLLIRVLWRAGSKPPQDPPPRDR